MPARDESELFQLAKLVGEDRSGDVPGQPISEIVEAHRLTEDDELAQDRQAPSVTEVFDSLAERAVVVDPRRIHLRHSHIGGNRGEVRTSNLRTTLRRAIVPMQLCGGTT